MHTAACIHLSCSSMAGGWSASRSSSRGMSTTTWRLLVPEKVAATLVQAFAGAGAGGHLQGPSSVTRRLLWLRRPETRHTMSDPPSCSVRIKRGAPNDGSDDDELSGVWGAAASTEPSRRHPSVWLIPSPKRHVRGCRVTKIPSTIQIIFYK
jgi:hypothetical protein